MKDQKIEKSFFPPPLMGAIADEIAKTVIQRLPHLLKKPARRKRSVRKEKRIENGLFFDTSAIIDGRIFDVLNLGFLSNPVVILESILLELKHIADSQDVVKRERGRKGLEKLEKIKKDRRVKVIVLDGEEEKKFAREGIKEVDEKLIKTAKNHKGRILTCDYNLEKKALIQGALAINMNALANCLKVTAVPGEALHILVLHEGKDKTQGVGYLDDGTMLVIENGSMDVGKTIDVVVSRVIQTTAGRILFAKKIV